jgi:hypothetical protein
MSSQAGGGQDRNGPVRTLLGMLAGLLGVKLAGTSQPGNP